MASRFVPMFGRVKSAHKGYLVVLALLSTILYAYLVPGHIAAQFAAHKHRADIALLNAAICTPDGSDTDSPEANCPICQGLASFSLFLLPPDAITLNAPLQSEAALTVAQDVGLNHKISLPRSRGPPQLS